MLADISGVDAVYIVCGRTDMRKSIDGLCAIIKEEFSMDMDHALFLFCGRRCDRLYRQERDWKQCGATISRTIFANCLIANVQDF